MIGSFEVVPGLDIACRSRKMTRWQLSVSFRLLWKVDAVLSQVMMDI
jgi:hypothetical protein